MAGKQSLVPSERIESVILLIRGHKVILDKDLAVLYGVTTGNLNKAVTRNIERFPDDFMFQLTKDEFDSLICHFGRSSWGGTRTLPRASVLRSKRAVQVGNVSPGVHTSAHRWSGSTMQ